MSDQGRAAAWDAGRRLFETMREQAEPGDGLPWEALSAETRDYYGRVARSFLAEARRAAQRDEGARAADPLAPLWWLPGRAGDRG
ncbi:MAG: hypothetical protein AVDCRST_MAG59-3310 [uncultured Thermomicrobiales bacterium]|uniref:Uncharacterized protein n=1 Tax=uncultured Thermomicrobiales bacterium TaxID=1645740 RepID=A0A6J4VAQ0_9BACT|nr:MAG: hypothetical protein AVDCRST_MAG59-3310 [uncultured Thermomicrobiales bacterium]